MQLPRRASHATIRFVAVNSEEGQAQVFGTRQMFVRQRTHTINALRGHLDEYGVIAPKCRAVRRGE